MFAWALGVVGRISEVGLEKVLQNAADQRGILPLLHFSTCFVCLVCAVSGWWFCWTPFPPLLSKKERVILQSFESLITKASTELSVFRHAAERHSSVRAFSMSSQLHSPIARGES